MHSAFTYTLFDIGGSLWGTVVFAAALLAPGYLACRGLDLADFRRRSPSEQLAWSVLASFGVAPIIVVAAVWLAGVTVAALVLAAVAILAAAIFLRTKPTFALCRSHLYFALWILFVIASLVDLGWGSRSWMSVTTYDHAVRVPFIGAILRTGVPPVNPLYWPGRDAPLRYYYFWYVLCAVIAKLAHITARQSLIASCVWPITGVIAAFALYGKYLLAWRGPVLRRRTRLAVFCLAITGLDVLIALFTQLSGDAAGADMEWWSTDQVTSWLDTFLWVPHHVAALVCCLFCFLLFWLARDRPPARRGGLHNAGLILLASLSFASAFGLSTYVAIGFCLLMACYLVWTRFVSPNTNQLQVIAATMLVALALLAPYLAQLTRSGGGAAASRPQHILALQVRRILDPGIFSAVPVLGRHPELEAAILLLPGYFIEFGFYALAAWLAFRKRDKTDAERTLLFLFAASLVCVSFLRSAVINTNDYGMRATLLAQFFAVLLAVGAWERAGKWPRRALFALAVIGVCGSAYQAVLLRFYLPVQQAKGNPDMHDLGERNAALREAYAQLKTAIPVSARIQYGAPAGGFFDGVHTLHAPRQIIAAGTTGDECNTGFGGDPSACAAIRASGARLYSSTPATPLSPAEAVELCRGMGAGYLVATRWDRVFSEADAWPRRLPPVVTTPDVRIVACLP